MSTRLKPYPAYKDSGVEWLGRIPAQWGLRTLKHRATFLGGGTPSKDNLEYWDGDIPWVSPKDMKNDLVSDSEEHITSQAVQASATRMVPSRSVLLVVRSGILKHTIPVAVNSRPVALNQDMKAIVPKSGLASGFLAWLFRGLQNRLLLEWRKAGATVESLEHDLIARTRIPLPDTIEQQSIASFLDRETGKIDALVAKKERLIELLQEKRTALISHAVTQGLNPDAPKKDSGIPWLGRIPVHWEVKRLKFVAPLQGGFAYKSDTFQDDGIHIVRMNNLKRGRLDFTEGVCVTSRDSQPEFGLREGDLLLGMSGSVGETGSLGNFAVVHRDDLPCELNQRVGRFRMKPQVRRQFISYFLQSPAFAHPLIVTATSTAQFNVSSDDVGSLWLGLPSEQEQQTIIDYLDWETAKLDALMAKVRAAIERLQEYRTALISAAVTGQIDVRQTQN